MTVNLPARFGLFNQGRTPCPIHLTGAGSPPATKEAGEEEFRFSASVRG